ncbi:flagellar motor switch protein FliN [Cryobacterium melibiosiphilum]|uniref:Flagellar motor switch protein FliN n=1 Tax=Cryobacterium melibiosiphilum TaxID=995039 RepID=A0A3A5MI42_9MICO|nr:flagellar motor switch protein FliN [Cryobacterium melibiosiphilum]RJT88725.1 flagellar motor switch protein FliN [Cryobacterium melibiosiphilum]
MNTAANTTATALPAAAVNGLILVLPAATALQATPHVGAVLSTQVGSAAVASFVGVTSADISVVLADPSSTDVAAGAASSLVSSHDVLRPALQAAAAVLGVGVLGDTRVEDASALFASDETVVFDLIGNGAVIGWFAIRLRKNGIVAGFNLTTPDTVVGKLGRIRNVEMALTVEIGRTRMSVRDVLSLEPGAVIELDRSAGAPADILLNGRLIAHGEIVVVDQDYAVRITQILDVAEGLA